MKCQLRTIFFNTNEMITNLMGLTKKKQEKERW